MDRHGSMSGAFIGEILPELAADADDVQWTLPSLHRDAEFVRTCFAAWRWDGREREREVVS